MPPYCYLIIVYINYKVTLDNTESCFNDTRATLYWVSAVNKYYVFLNCGIALIFFLFFYSCIIKISRYVGSYIIHTA